MKRLVATLIIACAVATFVAVAQSVLWQVGFETRFENREGGDELTPDQTIFYTRISPQVGITVPGDERHALIGGVSWFQPVTDYCDGYKVLPLLYYRYRNERHTLAVGYVDRDMASELPRYLMSDSLRYCTPVIRGVLYRGNGSRGYWQTILDWRQMQSLTRREAFVVTANGYYYLDGTAGRWALGGNVQYNHLAKRKNADESEGVNDDATVNPMLRWLPSQRWSMSAGAILQLQRARVDHKWHTPCAAIVTAAFKSRRFEINEELTAGKNLFPLYERFGSELNLGDPYYCYKFHSRTDADVVIFNRHGVDVRAGVSLQATDKTFGWWQTLKATVRLGGKFNNKKTKVD